MGRLLYAVAASAVICTPAAAERAEPRAVIQGQMDPQLKSEIQRVVGETDRPIENRFEARRRARAAAEDAIAVLRSEGYYAFEVTPDVSESDPPTPTVEIAPGPRFLLGDPRVTWKGAPPDDKTSTEAKRALGLRRGAPGRAADVVAAEGRLVAAVQKRGYADAAAAPRQVVVDHADHTVNPTYNVNSGPLVRLDGADIEGGTRTDTEWVRGLLPWRQGTTYDPDLVAELERRLLDTGAFNAVTVGVASADKTTPEGLRPVMVTLQERKPHTIEAGASYSTAEGTGVNVRWTRFNSFARADTLGIYGQVSDRDSRAGVDLSLPHWRRAQQTLKLGVVGYRERTDAYDSTGAGIHADVTRRYGRSSYITLGTSLDATHDEEIKAGTLSTLGRDLVTAAVLGDLLLDRSNDILNPTRGWRLTARLQPTLIVGDTNLPYLRALTQGTYYQPLDKEARTVVAARVRLGRIINGTVDQIPAPQRFYAGGGGSVRGFPFQAVGPRLDDGTPRGGTFLFESSLEVRRDITPKWGVVVFADAGAVGSSGPVDFQDLAVGAGFGVRYNLGFAPIRFDIATPVANRNGEPPIQVYVSIGQSF